MPPFLPTLRALDKAATPGKWLILGMPPDTCYIEPSINLGNGYEGEIKGGDALLIVLLRNSAARLAAVVEAAQAHVACVTDYLDNMDAENLAAPDVGALRAALLALDEVKA